MYTYHMYIYNLGQNIWGLLHFLAQFFFTTSETELDYYHQKVSVRVASRVGERLKTEDLRKFIYFILFIIYLGSIIVQMVLHPKLKK